MRACVWQRHSLPDSGSDKAPLPPAAHSNPGTSPHVPVGAVSPGATAHGISPARKRRRKPVAPTKTDVGPPPHAACLLLAVLTLATPCNTSVPAAVKAPQATQACSQAPSHCPPAPPGCVASTARAQGRRCRGRRSDTHRRCNRCTVGWHTRRGCWRRCQRARGGGEQFAQLDGGAHDGLLQVCRPARWQGRRRKCRLDGRQQLWLRPKPWFWYVWLCVVD